MKTSFCISGRPTCPGPQATHGDPCGPCTELMDEEFAVLEASRIIQELARCITRFPELWQYGNGSGGWIAKALSEEMENMGWSTVFKPYKPRPEVLRIAERDGWDCHYCSQPLNGKPDRPNPHVDHVIPKSRNGSEDLSNKVLACPTCNCAKGARTPEEWGNQ